MTTGKVSARIKWKLLSWILRILGSVKGFNSNGLERVQEYLRVSLGLQEARYTNPLQRPRHYFSGLTAKPWHDASEFELTAKLENAYQTIKSELSEIPRSCFRPQHQGIAEGGQWNVFYLYYLGRRVEQNCRLCPRTTHIINSVPEVTNTGLVYFSVLTQGSHILPHCGPLNTRLRCHLGVVVPEGCQIRVGKEPRSWEEGKCFVFDDSFEHEVWNSAQSPRTVLIVDFWHPDLTPVETWALGEIMKISPEARNSARTILKGKGAM